MFDQALPPTQLIALFEQLPGCWGCKDTQSRFVHVNKAYANLVGVSSPNALVGQTDDDLPGRLASCAARFQQQDKQVLATGRPMRVLNIHPYTNGYWQAHVFTKILWKDDEGRVLGTIFHGQPLDENPMLEVGQWLCKAFEGQGDAAFSTHRADLSVHLSNRESEVLFFHLYGKKPQFIAQALGVSVKTVENHFANLRVKLGAGSKTEIVDKALELGVGCKIPASLLNQQLTMVLAN